MKKEEEDFKLKEEESTLKLEKVSSTRKSILSEKKSSTLEYLQLKKLQSSASKKSRRSKVEE